MAIVWTDVGQAQAVDVLDPNTRAAVSTTYYGHWGSSATAPAVSQTALVSANAEARAAATVTQPAANKVLYSFTMTATGTRTVQEVGVFDANAAGNMILRGTHGSLTLETGSAVAYALGNTLKDSSE